MDQLYDLQNDPNERNNISSINKEQVLDMRSELKRIVESGEYYKKINFIE